jgi:CheY-like chemotaxis protein
MGAEGQGTARKSVVDDAEVRQRMFVVDGKKDVTQRVLVVDDERHIADTFSLILQQKGYATAVAYNGEAAIETARRFRPHLLVTDIKMPGINGIEAAIAILDFLPRCFVLFISGHASTQDVLADSRGHQFRFEICTKPIAPAALLKKIEEILAAAAAPTLTVLNVDDDEAHRYTVTRILKHAGLRVEEAKTGAEGLRLARSIPDLILLDVHLPDMSGFDVLRQLKASPETAHIPVVHLTNTCRDDQSRETGLQLGAEDFLTYPVDPEPLVTRLREVAAARIAKQAKAASG